MHLKIAQKSLGLLLLLYTALRIVFLFLNRHSFQKFDPGMILGSLVSGIRFDISAILILNLPLLLVFLLLSPRFKLESKVHRFTHWAFIFINFPFIAANLADSEYYKFTGSRMSAEIFFFQKEAGNQLGQFIVNYYYLVFLGVVAFFSLYKFFPSPSAALDDGRSNSTSRHFRTAVIGVLISALIFIGIRGGFQPKPIQPAHAYSAGVSELGVLTLNTTFTLLKSKVNARIKPAQYFNSTQDVFAALKRNPLNYFSGQVKTNVVLIILESFSTEFWGAANTYKGYTPFLDVLARKGLFLKNNFANGRRSIDALPAILFGIPPFMSVPVVKSNYYSNTWAGLGSAVKKAGYHVSFFHGAPKGTMYFDAISALAGFDDYYPLERYQGPAEFDGHWGIYDAPFMQFMIKKLNKHPQPFLTTVFTISTHQPYHVPSQYEGRFPTGPLKIHESIGYVDYAVEQFFKEAAKQPWYENTLFVITGDHTQMSEAEHYNSTLGRFMVPLLLFHPKDDFSTQNRERITQQADIMPSVLDYLGLHNEPYLLFGRSVFDEQETGEAIFQQDGSYWLVRSPYYLRFSESENKSYLFKLDDPNQTNPLTDQDSTKVSLEKRLKAYVQYFRNGLIENNLYNWR